MNNNFVFETDTDEITTFPKHPSCSYLARLNYDLAVYHYDSYIEMGILNRCMNDILYFLYGETDNKIVKYRACRMFYRYCKKHHIKLPFATN